MKGIVSEEAVIVAMLLIVAVIVWYGAFIAGFKSEIKEIGNSEGEYQIVFFHKSDSGAELFLLEDRNNPNNLILRKIRESKNGENFHAVPGGVICITKRNTIVPCGSFMQNILNF